jgi:hypothetical protein
MQWLACRVDLQQKKTSKEYNLYKYEDWNTRGVVVLSKSIILYGKDEQNQPTKPLDFEINFKEKGYSPDRLSDSFYLQ